MTGQVDGVGAGLHDVAENDLVDRVFRHAAALDRRRCRRDGQIGCGEPGKGSAEISKWGARSGEHHDIGIFNWNAHVGAQYSAGAATRPGRRRRRGSLRPTVHMPINRPAASTLDARSLTPATKTEQILESFDRLQIGSAVEINEETDPRALRNEMAQLRPGRFSWDARNLGGNRWTVRLERIDENADGQTFLSHVSAFTSAKAATMKELAAQMSERTYRSSDTIFDEGEVWPYLGIVKSGKVIYTLLSPDGKTHTIGERLTHDTLNESGTFDGGGATTRAEALTDATIVTLPSEAVLHAVRNDAELALGFLIASSQARRRSIDTIADLAFAHVLQRVAKFLLGYARTSVGMARGLPGVENLSQAQIAAAAGTVRDMAARALLRLRTAGALELDRGRVKAIDRARLEAFAHNVQAPPV